MNNPIKLAVVAIFGVLTLLAVIFFGAAYETVSEQKTSQ